MADTLRQCQHLIRYAHWAYKNDDGTEFRSMTPELRGDVRYRKLHITTPFLKHVLQYLAPNTHVHLGIRGCDTIVIAFRGTDFPFTTENLVNPKRWWGFWGNVFTDLAFQMTPVGWLSDQDVTGGDADAPLVHEGFLEAFEDLIEGEPNRLRSAILGLTDGSPPQRIEVCGHSLGGALATLCALWCRRQWPKAKLVCVTLGSPRVGNTAFARRFNDAGILCYRLVMQGDPIPTIPDRFSQAIPLKLPQAPCIRNCPSPQRYYHVGVPLLLHSAANAVDFNVERPDIRAEEMAGPLPRYVTLPYKLGGFLPYWLVRGLRMAPLIWSYHNPNLYETTVQRILEAEAARVEADVT
ncbi:hypothetical protein VTJ49DRAFT_955 [Mycothermus thermophilus]|uniref:Fungal lipase-type domain-containing protein n=1 Tax=Humicola insolens TaxID=85995 RepID=A0ABR3VE55_HUMIN